MPETTPESRFEIHNRAPLSVYSTTRRSTSAHRAACSPRMSRTEVGSPTSRAVKERAMMMTPCLLRASSVAGKVLPCVSP